MDRGRNAVECSRCHGRRGCHGDAVLDLHLEGVCGCGGEGGEREGGTGGEGLVGSGGAYPSDLGREGGWEGEREEGREDGRERGRRGEREIGIEEAIVKDRR